MSHVSGRSWTLNALSHYRNAFFDHWTVNCLLGLMAVHFELQPLFSIVSTSPSSSENDIVVFYLSEFHHWIIWMVDNRRMSESSITSKSLRFWKSIWTRCLEKWNTVKWLHLITPEINGRSKDQTERSKCIKNNGSQDHRRMKVDGRVWQKLRHATQWKSSICITLIIYS